MAEEETKPIKIFGNDRLSDRVQLFKQKAEKPQLLQKQKSQIAEEEKEPVKIFGNDRLSDRVQLFKQKAEKHQSLQKQNPFSSSYDKNAVTSTGMSKDDPRYGRPPEGSKTELRGKKAHSHVSKEVVELCTLIREYGELQDDGSVAISFGELFQMYTTISNKLVGMLLRARKHGLLDFQGEMLFQRRDEEKIITLFPWEDEEEDEEA